MTRACIVVSLALPALLLPAIGKADEARRTRVENGLLPRLWVEGAPKFTIEERLRRHRVPAVSIAVIDQFDLAWSKAYGLADVEAGRVATERTLFQAGQVSQLPTLVAIAALEDRGEFRLKEDVRPWIDEARTAVAPATAAAVATAAHATDKPITWGSLLSNKRFLLGYVNDGVDPSVDPPDTTMLIRRALGEIEEGSANRKPFEGIETIVLSQALQQLVRQPFPEWIDGAVLAPAEMTSSHYEQPLRLDHRRWAATGHRYGKPIPGKMWNYADVAGRGLWTTPTDLARLALQLQRAGRGDTTELLPPRVTRMWIPRFFNLYDDLSGAPNDHIPDDYLQIWGQNQGYHAAVIVHRSLGCGVVVMANEWMASSLVAEIVRAVAHEYQWPGFLQPPDPAPGLTTRQLAAFTGRYHLDGVRIATIELDDDGRLTWRDPYNPDPVVVLPLSESRAVIPDFSDELEFLVAEDGTIDGFELERDNGTVVVWRRVAEGRTLPVELLEAGKLEAAMKLLETYEPEDPQFWIHLGQGLHERGHPAAAAAVLRMATRRLADPAPAFEKLAGVALAAGDRHEAAVSALAALELLPANLDVGSQRFQRVLKVATEVLANIITPESQGPDATEVQRRQVLAELMRTAIDRRLTVKEGTGGE